MRWQLPCGVERRGVAGETMAAAARSPQYTTRHDRERMLHYDVSALMTEIVDAHSRCATDHRDI